VLLIRSRMGKIRGGGGYAPGRAQFGHSYEDIISVENLLAAWKEFVNGKRKKRDVQEFQHRLMDNVLALHRELAAGTYRHGGYRPFKIADPKPRDIHKATVRDRLLHHALYRQLYPFFDRTWIADSYSCREGKGTHRAVNRFRAFAYKASRNRTRTCWVLKCDIWKFFASIYHRTLFDIVARYVPDKRILALLEEVAGSFHSTEKGKGLPLGNLTSQLFVNVYMNEFDQFVKHGLRAQCYVRYADDFVVLSHNKQWLERLTPRIADFLRSQLSLTLHPNKVDIRTLASGVDFLGWVHFPDHRVLRTSTRHRMMRVLANSPSEETLESYQGLLSHGNTMKLRRTLGNNESTPAVRAHLA
jgi:RNA-directed DNA polymerase